MMIRPIFRQGVAVLIGVVLAGCSSVDLGGSSRGDARCRINPSSCIYEGSYDPGEREYAEEEARRLNRAEGERLRRMRR